MSHGPDGAFVLNLQTYFVDVLLKLSNGIMGLHTIRHEQLVPPGRDS